jgi:hypothetical protein
MMIHLELFHRHFRTSLSYLGTPNHRIFLAKFLLLRDCVYWLQPEISLVDESGMIRTQLGIFLESLKG